MLRGLLQSLQLLATSSAGYAVHVTLGQTARGPAHSAQHAAGLGYWYRVGGGARIYLPLVVRNAPYMD
jgi:hypothetical protein